MDGWTSDRLITRLGELNSTMGRIADALERAYPKPQVRTELTTKGSEKYYEGPYGYRSRER